MLPNVLAVLGLLAILGVAVWAFKGFRKPGRVRQWIRFLVTCLFFALALFMLGREVAFQRSAKATTGVLLPGIIEHTRKALWFTISKTYDVKYVFNVSGDAISGRDNIESLPDDPTITVYYDPTYPWDNRGEKKSLWLYGFGVLMTAGSVWFFGGVEEWFQIRRAKRTVDLKMRGYQVQNAGSFLLRQGEMQTGPHTIKELRLLWRAGMIGYDAQYWIPGAEEWMPIQRLRPALDRSTARE